MTWFKPFKKIDRKRLIQFIIILLVLGLVTSSSYLTLRKFKPTADVESEEIPPPKTVVAYPICFGTASGDISDNNGCNGELAIALFASSPPRHEDNDLNVLVEVNHTPTAPDDFDNPEYDDRWYSYSVTENADQDYDAEGNMIPDSWRSSNGFGFIYLYREPSLNSDSVYTLRFRLTYYDPLTGDESPPVEQTLVFPMPLEPTQPQPF